MKIYKLFNYALAATAALLITSCSDESDLVNHNGPVEARFTTNLGAGWATRASNTSWSANDRVGVTAVSVGSTLSSESVFSEYKVEAGGSSATLLPVNEPVYYPADDSKVNFVAFYPYKEPVNRKVTYSGFENQTTQADMAKLDVLYSYDAEKIYSQESPEATLDFTHKLSFLTIFLNTVDSGDTKIDMFNIAEVSVSQLPAEAELDLATGNCTPMAGATTTKMFFMGFGHTQQAKAIIVPHTPAGTNYMNRTLTVKMEDGASYAYVLPNDRAFEAGKSYLFNLELTTNGLRMRNTSSTDWTDDFTTWGNDLAISSPQSVVTLNYEACDNYELSFKTNGTAEVKYSDSATDADAGVTGDWLKEATAATEVGSEADYTEYTYALAVTENAGVGRTGYIHITVGTLKQVVKIKQKGLPNSYMVKPGETVELPVARANAFAQSIGEADVIGDATVFTGKVLWMDAQSLIDATDPANLETESTGKTGHIKVKAATGQTGNAVVAVMVNNKIVWSWHIWVTDYTPNPQEYQWMDRNLGAITNVDKADGSTGLYYQWGRKDPFPGSGSAIGNSNPFLYNAAGNKFTYTINENTVGELEVPTLIKAQQNIRWTVENPLTFIGYDGSWMSDATESNRNWNTIDNQKALFDPCPDGYRAFQSYSNKDWYPLSGYRNSADGRLAGVNLVGRYWYGHTGDLKYVAYMNISNEIFSFQIASHTFGLAIRCMVEAD